MCEHRAVGTSYVSNGSTAGGYDVTTRSGLLLLGAAAGLVLLSGGVAAASVAPEPPVPTAPQTPTVGAPSSVTLPTDAEAWYQLTKVNSCSSPAGCLPAEVPALPAVPDLPVNPTVFPADTLHVGWAAGVELARSYVKLDRSALPHGAKLVGGELTVPLIADPTSGTVLASGAGVKACLVTTAFTDGVAGSLSAAPGMDCGISSPLDAEGDHYTVDLQPFVDAWNAGTPDDGIALTPFDSSSFESAWAIAVPGRNAAGLPHVEAHLQYVLARAAVPPVVAPAAPAVGVTQPVQAPVQQAAPAAAERTVQIPPLRGRPRTSAVAAGMSPLGWLALAAGILACVTVGFVATRPVQARL
jgi:hypothetical protein